jgi:hypothetical protein
MCANTGFHADQARRNIGQPGFDLATRPFSPQRNNATIIQPYDVERVLTNIDADHGNALLRFWDMTCSLCLKPLAGGAGSTAGPSH